MGNHAWVDIALSYGLALVVALVSTPIIIKLAPGMGAVDQPGPRKMHTSPMPTIGGVAIYLGFMISMIINGQTHPEAIAILLGGSVILVIGLIDDIYDISPYLKLAGQILAALIVVYFGIRVEFITSFLSGEAVSLGILTVPVTVLWIIAVINSINLIDGLDGLAAGVSTIAAVTIAIIALREGQTMVAMWAFVLAGSTTGFLRYNFNPARIFMGDSGSMFLGYNLAVFALMGHTKSTTILSLIIPLIILGLPLLDTSFAIIRRAIGGKHIFQADRDHLHHRLLASGMSHRSTVLTIYAVSAIYSVCAIAITYFTTPQAFMVLGVLTVSTVVGAGWLGVLRIDLTTGKNHLAGRYSQNKKIG
ncbi:MAG: undecaprenyl/decaprenyl-phosphate alpha-N-acetylglucosaminyl 1-phosphate transferase [Firmicutes bacterium]|nr:undecaprenyl/decaprenyl-phosphate alpha-N-acetylglucosaminyl 1-phosphate transferase [Bacillota bacterium]